MQHHMVPLRESLFWIPPSIRIAGLTSAFTPMKELAPTWYANHAIKGASVPHFPTTGGFLRFASAGTRAYDCAQFLPPEARVLLTLQKEEYMRTMSMPKLWKGASLRTSTVSKVGVAFEQCCTAFAGTPWGQPKAGMLDGWWAVIADWWGPHGATGFADMLRTRDFWADGAPTARFFGLVRLLVVMCFRKGVLAHEISGSHELAERAGAIVEVELAPLLPHTVPMVYVALPHAVAWHIRRSMRALFTTAERFVQSNSFVVEPAPLPKGVKRQRRARCEPSSPSPPPPPEKTHCVCCFEEQCVGEQWLRLACGHAFHAHCVLSHAEHTTAELPLCPLCKQHVFDAEARATLQKEAPHFMNMEIARDMGGIELTVRAQ